MFFQTLARNEPILKKHNLSRLFLNWGEGGFKTWGTNVLKPTVRVQFGALLKRFPRRRREGNLLSKAPNKRQRPATNGTPSMPCWSTWFEESGATASGRARARGSSGSGTKVAARGKQGDFRLVGGTSGQLCRRPKSYRNRGFNWGFIGSWKSDISKSDGK